MILASQDRVDERICWKRPSILCYGRKQNKSTTRLGDNMVGTARSFQFSGDDMWLFRRIHSTDRPITRLTAHHYRATAYASAAQRPDIVSFVRGGRGGDLSHQSCWVSVDMLTHQLNHGVASIACGVQKARISSSHQWQCRRIHSHDSLRNGLVKKSLDIVVHLYVPDYARARCGCCCCCGRVFESSTLGRKAVRVVGKGNLSWAKKNV